MKPNPWHSSSEPAYSDQQVLEAIREDEGRGSLVLKWFFGQIKVYALGYLTREFPRIETMEWDAVLANTNLKLVSRVRRGLQLEADTQLATYYVSVARFATLDLIREQKETAHQEVSETDLKAEPRILDQLEQKDRARYIRDKLVRIVENEEQVSVLLLQAKGYSFRDIVAKTSYQSEGACRNAALKAKQKISSYLVEHPQEAANLRALLLGQ